MSDLQDCLGLIGKSISVPEATNIKCSLTSLTQTVGRPVNLWGKIEGYNGDYFIAQALSAKGATDVAGRTSWCSIDSGITWVPLASADAISDEQKGFCDQLRGPFMGQPAYEYKVQKELPQEEPAPVQAPTVEDEPAEVEDQADADEDEDGNKAEGDAAQDAGDEEDGEKKVAVKRPKFRILSMTETIRLAFFVIEHDRQCAIVPRASYLQKDDGVIVANRSFQGLTVDAARNLRNYFHCVAPPLSSSQPVSNQDLFANEYNRNWDFLSSVVVDMPTGVWSVKYDALINIVAVQNQLFQGSIFWHKPTTAKHGQLYWGKGERNLDLCFVLP